MFTNIKGAIFDMDGTLIDSMWVWSRINIDYLARKNIEVPERLRDDVEHLGFLDCAKYFKNSFNLEESLEEIMATWNDMAVSAYTNDITIKDGAFEFLTKLKDSGVKLALATSNCNHLLEIGLKKFGLFKLFDEIVTIDMVDKPKSEPDIFLKAAELIKVKPSDCIVFEDILPAVKAAKKGDFKVVAVKDSSTEKYHDEIEGIADLFITDFTEIKY